MAGSNIPPPLPSQSELAEMYNISHTTVRHILQHLSACGVLTLVRKNYAIARRPEQNDGFDCTTASLKEQSRPFEQAFFAATSLRQLHARKSFSELQLVRAASVSPVMVREYLLKFGRHNFIRNEEHGQ